MWTGDDRVFFFNPTMQLSVWEKPVDLKHRGDLNRIIEDPPHKRKLEASAGTELGTVGPWHTCRDCVFPRAGQESMLFLVMGDTDS